MTGNQPPLGAPPAQARLAAATLAFSAVDAFFAASACTSGGLSSLSSPLAMHLEAADFA